jgi:hypothetical protein
MDALQLAIYSQLDGDAAVTPDVKDYVAEGQTLPVIVIGEFSAAGGQSKSMGILDATTVIHIWTDDPGMKTLNEYMDAIASSLASVETLAAPWHVGKGGPTLELAEALVEQDPEGNVLRHGIMRFRWLVSYSAS